MASVPWFGAQRVERLVAFAVVNDGSFEAAEAQLAKFDMNGELAPYGLRLRAALSAHSKRFGEARALLARALVARNGPEDAGERRHDQLFLCELLLAEERCEEALNGLDELAKAYPSGPPASWLHARGLALAGLGRTSDAIEALKDSVECCLRENEGDDAAHVRLESCPLFQPKR
ncbi:MAG: hypothetical protein QM784_17615 [Polyangiaceae bacterium]